MKHILLAIVLLTGLGSIQAQKVKLIHVTFKYSFAHDPQGKEINSRLKVYVDDVAKGVSLAKMESEANSLTIEIPAGHHKIRAVIESQFEEGWEEHIIANEYTIDCIYVHEGDYKGNARIELVFDLESGTVVIDHQVKNGNFNSTF